MTMKAGRDDDDQDEGPGCEAGLRCEEVSDTLPRETRQRALRRFVSDTRPNCEAALRCEEVSDTLSERRDSAS